MIETREFKTSPHRRAIVAAALRRRKANLKAAGLCQDCGAGTPVANRSLCAHCLASRRRRPDQVDPLRKLTFSIPLTPPSVNHYVEHKQIRTRKGPQTLHIKTPEALAWERDFAIFARHDEFVQSDSGRFAATIEIFFGAREHGDIDNFPKCVLDCAAKRGMLRGRDGKPRSDSWVKRLQVVIHDSASDREQGPLTRITLEAL